MQELAHPHQLLQGICHAALLLLVVAVEALVACCGSIGGMMLVKRAVRISKSGWRDALLLHSFPHGLAQSVLDVFTEGCQLLLHRLGVACGTPR